MEGRALRLMLISLAIAALLFWIVKPKRAKPARVETGILPPGAQLRLEGVVARELSADRDMQLTTRDVEWLHESDLVHLNGVDIQVMGASSNGTRAVIGRLSSDEGEATKDGQIDLEGSVLAETFDGYRLQTSDVSYDNHTRLASTASSVLIEGPGLHVTGRGADVDLDSQIMTVRGRVHAHLVPNVLQEHGEELNHGPVSP